MYLRYYCKMDGIDMDGSGENLLSLNTVSIIIVILDAVVCLVFLYMVVNLKYCNKTAELNLMEKYISPKLFAL